MKLQATYLERHDGWHWCLATKANSVLAEGYHLTSKTAAIMVCNAIRKVLVALQDSIVEGV